MSIELKEKRRLNSLKVFLKVTSAYFLSFFFRPTGNKKIALVGGNLGEKYEDNASVFHSYLINNYSEKVTAYWMYDPVKSFKSDRQIPNAVALGSFKNYLLFFKADYTFHGHSLMYDIAPSVDKFLFLNRKTVITHISHGIEGFKKILIQKEDVPLLRRTNYFNCASVYERNLKRDEWKIPEEKLIITGFPRFDRFPTNQPAPEVKKILMMMTWREWLFELSEEEFIKSDYFQNTVGLIAHEGIRQVIAENGMKMRIVLHPFMRKFEQHFIGLDHPENGIEFMDFNKMTIERAIIEHDMLLTDITSVSWDFLYLNKPIIFHMFDKEEYLARRGTYLSLDTDLYGYKADSIDEVYGFLKKIVEEGINTNDWYSKAPAYIDYYDQKNCERLAQKVIGI